MTNNDKHEWTFDKAEIDSIKMLEELGFEVTVEKRFISKDYLTVSKDGITDKLELPLGNNEINYRKYISQYVKSFERLRELITLRNAADKL